MRLCEFGVKALRFGTMGYSDWRKKHVLGKESVEVEDDEEDDDEGAMQVEDDQAREHEQDREIPEEMDEDAGPVEAGSGPRQPDRWTRCSESVMLRVRQSMSRCLPYG